MLATRLFFSLVFCTLAYLTDASYPGNKGGQTLSVLQPDLPVVNFVYRPTPEGYSYSYRLADGRQHIETAYIVDPNSPEAAAYIQNEAARRAMPRPKGTKNRKLSPKSLQSLAG